jgi:hypothetical protein
MQTIIYCTYISPVQQPSGFLTPNQCLYVPCGRIDKHADPDLFLHVGVLAAPLRLLGLWIDGAPGHLHIALHKPLKIRRLEQFLRLLAQPDLGAHILIGGHEVGLLEQMLDDAAHQDKRLGPPLHVEAR